MTKLKRLSIGLAVAVIAAAGYAVFDFWARREVPTDDILLYGNIDIREADLAFNVPGRIEGMLVDEGDLVESGQLIATLEADIYQSEVAVAKARVGAQRAVLDRLLAGSRPEEIVAARANVRAIKADLVDAKTDLARTKQLTTDQFASVQKLDDDRARVHTLEARLTAAKQELSLAVQGPRAEDIAEARAQIQANESELLLAEQRLDYTKLFAKNRGVVKTRIVEPGAVVTSQAPAYTIALSDPVWARTYVSEPDLGRIHPGMAAEVVTDSAPDKAYQGWVGYVSPVAEFTPKTVETREVRTSLVYRLRVYVKNPNTDLRQGMPVTVLLKPERDGGEAGNSASQ